MRGLYFVIVSSETIVALSTPLGRSGIGVIRLSGAQSLHYVRLLLNDENFTPQANHVTLKTIIAPESGAVLDHALVTYFKEPHSFTGEDTVELSCHGSPVLLMSVLDALLRLGARTADPGEFTLRSLSNNRLNLSQAEAIRDLIDAQTNAAVKQAVRQLGGELSLRLQPIKNDLISIIVSLESSLEFVEDDLPQLAWDKLNSQLNELTQTLNNFALTFHSGRLLKDGLKIVLVGRPNVGKSSVFNALLSLDRAIVTAFPGTTRDSLSEMLNLNGVPILLTDTAGIHVSSDPIESIGIDRTRRAIADADLIVVVLDNSLPLTKEDLDILADVSNAAYLIALNKCDLTSYTDIAFADCVQGKKAIRISAKTGEGLDDLRESLSEPFAHKVSSDVGLLITNSRHYDLLRRSVDALSLSGESFKRGASEDLILVGLYDALRYLGEITGETTSEDVLTQIFSTFCIGK